MVHARTKEQENGLRDIFRSFLRGIYCFAVFGIREPGVDRLIEEEDVRVAVPRVLEEHRLVSGICYATWSCSLSIIS